MSEAAPVRTRIKELEVMVADVVPETHDTVTLVLFTGNDRLDYKAGHFLTIDPHQFEALERFTAFLEDLKARKEPPRAYSMVSAPHERYLAVTVKEERYASGQTKYPPAALAPPGQAHGPGPAPGRDRLHRALHPARRHRGEDRPPRPPVRGLRAASPTSPC